MCVCGWGGRKVLEFIPGDLFSLLDFVIWFLSSTFCSRCLAYASHIHPSIWCANVLMVKCFAHSFQHFQWIVRLSHIIFLNAFVFSISNEIISMWHQSQSQSIARHALIISFFFLFLHQILLNEDDDKKSAHNGQFQSTYKRTTWRRYEHTQRRLNERSNESRKGRETNQI